MPVSEGVSVSESIGIKATSLPLESNSGELSKSALLKAGILALLVAGTFWSSLWRLWSKTNPFYGEANWGHAVIVPFVGLYYLYLHRDELLKAPIIPSIPAWRGWLRVLLVTVPAALAVVLFLLPIGKLVLNESTVNQLGFLFGNATVMSAVLASFAAVCALGTGYRILENWSGALLALIGCAAVHLVAPRFTGSIATFASVAGNGMILLGSLVFVLNWGIGSLVFGLLTFGYGIWPGQNDYVKDLGLVITVFGIVLGMCGWRVMQVAWFPIAFLVCALPWPGLFYSWLAGPLQELAAMVSVFVLQMTGVDATQGGTKIIMEFGSARPPRTLNVAEACAGLRSLMTFITLGAALGFLSSRPLWQKLLITFMAIPIAILCNVMRVSGQGLLDVYVSEKLAEGFAHQFVGLVMIIPAFLLLLGVCWIIDQLFVEEVELSTTAATTKVTKVRRVAATSDVAKSTELGDKPKSEGMPNVVSRRPRLEQQ